MAVIHIKGSQKKYWSFAYIVKKIKRAFYGNNSVLSECALTNTHRIYYLSMISIPIRIIDIIQFAFTESNDTQVYRIWSRSIITSHFIILLIMIVFFFITRKHKNKKEPDTLMFVLQYTAAAVIMVSGIIIVTIDQLVTTNITPFILICIVVGSILLFRPIASFIIYTASYVMYYILLALTITDQNILLSNRVNGITAVGLGFFLNFLLWGYNYTNIIQKRRIEKQQKQLEKMAYYDLLTDLPNRRMLEKLVRQEFSLMQRYGHETAIIILDIDDFKKINDKYGHLVGDSILKQLAELLQNNVRESDTVARFGGEEFIILLPGTSMEEGSVFAERLRKLIMEKRFTIGSITLQITSSFGISSISDFNSETLKDYYMFADKALYLAKQKGKNRVETLEYQEDHL